MKKKIIIIFSLGALIYGGWFTYIKYKRYTGKRLYEKVKDNPKVYVYETFYDFINPAFYIKDLKYKENLITYYDSVENGIEIPMGFPIKYMPLSFEKPSIILLGFIDKDSTIAEVIDFKKSCWGYIKGFVYYKTLHLNPPADSLIRKFEKHFRELKNTTKYREKQKYYLYKKPSEYGLHCN